MLNRLCMTGGTLGLVLILLFGRDVASYITTSADHLSESVRNHIPVEFEIERARRMIEDLTPEIREGMVAIAREEIDMEQLDEQITELEAYLETERSALEHLEHALRSERAEHKLGTTVYTSAETADLARTRFERFQTQAVTLKNLQRVRGIRLEALRGARNKLEEIVSSKEQLTAEVASLEARQKMNEVTRSANEMNASEAWDESQLTRTRELIREIETRIRVEERLTATELHFMEEVAPVAAATSPKTLAEKIANYFADEDVESQASLELLAQSGTDEAQASDVAGGNRPN